MFQSFPVRTLIRIVPMDMVIVVVALIFVFILFVNKMFVGSWIIYEI